jgi:hypothetical protein
MSIDRPSVSKAQWAKLSLAVMVVLLLVGVTVLGGIQTNPGSVSNNPSISLLEQSAQSNRYSHTIYVNGSSIFVTDYSVVGNSTKLLTSNPMDAARVINNVLSNLSPLSGALKQVQIVQLKGPFIINSPILVPSWCLLDLRSAALTLANATDNDMITNSRRFLGNEMIGVVGGVLDGNKVGQTGGSRAEPASAVIHFWSTHEVLVKDVQLKNAKWENLLFSICHNVLVKNVDSQGAGYMGIATEFGSHDVLIANCRTYNNEVNGILIGWNNVTVILNVTINLPDGYNTLVSNCDVYNNGVYGVSIEGYSSTRNFTVTNCSIHGNAFAGVHIGTGTNLLITKSNISYNGFACRVTVDEQNPSATDPVNGLTISNSTIHDNQNGGVYLIGTSDKWIQNVLIIYNQFYNNNGTDIHKQYASVQSY